MSTSSSINIYIHHTSMCIHMYKNKFRAAKSNAQSPRLLTTVDQESDRLPSKMSQTTVQFSPKSKHQRYLIISKINTYLSQLQIITWQIIHSTKCRFIYLNTAEMFAPVVWTRSPLSETKLKKKKKTPATKDRRSCKSVLLIYTATSKAIIKPITRNKYYEMQFIWNIAEK